MVKYTVEVFRQENKFPDETYYEVDSIKISESGNAYIIKSDSKIAIYNICDVIKIVSHKQNN